MVFRKALKCGVRLVLALTIGLVLVGSLPTPVQAQQPIDLQLGGEGATSWNIDNIKPGDSGTKTVELHNAGSQNGLVTIWISDINETDYAGDGTALDDYLRFNLSHERLINRAWSPTPLPLATPGRQAAEFSDTLLSERGSLLQLQGVELMEWQTTAHSLQDRA